MGDIFNCGCGGNIDWEEIERILREAEEGKTEAEPEAIPVEDDDVFSPVRKTEEVEVE
jgi:hypothetical protein